MFSRKDKTNFLELYSNENIGHTLSKLKFESMEDLHGRHIGYYKMRRLEEESTVFAEILRVALAKRRKFDKYIYEIKGSNLTRFNPSEPPKVKKKLPYRLSKTFTVTADLDPKPIGITYVHD